MEQLDDLLVARHVDLDEEDPPLRETSKESEDNDQSCERREKLTESLLRNDVVAPHVIKFTPTYNPYKKYRRVFAIGFAVGLSIYSLFHFSKVVYSLSHEATLDIESGMAANEHSVDSSSNALAEP